MVKARRSRMNKVMYTARTKNGTRKVFLGSSIIYAFKPNCLAIMLLIIYEMQNPIKLSKDRQQRSSRIRGIPAGLRCPHRSAAPAVCSSTAATIIALQPIPREASYKIADILSLLVV